MVQLIVTTAAKAAITEYCNSDCSNVSSANDACAAIVARTASLVVGDPIDHDDMIKISQFLTQESSGNQDKSSMNEGRKWHLDVILKGTALYRAPPARKPKPTPEFEALMRRLREEEEQRQYERMLNPPLQTETFSQRFPNSPSGAGAVAAAANSADDVDEMTYADVNRQMALIMNVLVSIIACSVSIWIAARRWEAPQRLALSLFGSTLVAVAEVAIYFGYIRRVSQAKTKEKGLTEEREVVETWVIEGSSKPDKDEPLRYRKGKHR